MRRLSLALALLASASAATVVRHSATGQCLTRDWDGFLSTAACDTAAANQHFETRITPAQQTEIVSHAHGRGTACLSLKPACEAQWLECPDNKNEIHRRTLWDLEPVAGGGVLLVNSNEKTTCLQLEANGHLRKNKPSAMFSGAKCDAGSAAQTFVFYDATTAAGDMEMADLVVPQPFEIALDMTLGSFDEGVFVSGLADATGVDEDAITVDDVRAADDDGDGRRLAEDDDMCSLCMEDAFTSGGCDPTAGTHAEVECVCLDTVCRAPCVAAHGDLLQEHIEGGCVGSPEASGVRVDVTIASKGSDADRLVETMVEVVSDGELGERIEEAADKELAKTVDVEKRRKLEAMKAAKPKAIQVPPAFVEVAMKKMAAIEQKKERDCVCTREYQPHCGVMRDGSRETFSNKCAAKCAGAVTGKNGACPEDPKVRDRVFVKIEVRSVIMRDGLEEVAKMESGDRKVKTCGRDGRCEKMEAAKLQEVEAEAKVEAKALGKELQKLPEDQRKAKAKEVREQKKEEGDKSWESCPIKIPEGLDSDCPPELKPGTACKVKCAQGFASGRSGGYAKCSGGAIDIGGFECTAQSDLEKLRAVFTAADPTWATALVDSGGSMEDPCASSGIICSQPSLDTANPVVTGIVFENKGLAGLIPPQLGALTNLNKLGLASNKLEGPIPGELGNLKSLEQLKLNENSGLVGAIPLELGNLEALKVLMLDDNSHDGQIPRSFGRLSELVEFSLAGNKLTGPIPEELGELAKVVELYLHDNDLTGKVPAALGGLSALSTLYLKGNSLTGCLPYEWQENDIVDYEIGTGYDTPPCKAGESVGLLNFCYAAKGDY